MLVCFMAAFDTVFFIVTLSLAVQLVVLALLLIGYVFVRKLKFRIHGSIMAIAVAVHLAAVFFIMVPSFVAAVLPQFILLNPLGLTSLVSLAHEVSGILALALGVWFVARWRYRKDFKGCFNKRLQMQATMIIWLVALVFGVALYLIFNWTLLVG